VLAWLATLSIAIAAVWLVFGTVDAVVRQHAPGVPTADAPHGEGGQAARRADQR